MFTIYEYKNKDYLVSESVPDGFQLTKGTLTQPKGTEWYDNGYSMLDKNEHGTRKRLQILVIENLEQFKTTCFYKKSTQRPLNYSNYALELKPKGAE